MTSEALGEDLKYNMLRMAMGGNDKPSKNFFLLLASRGGTARSAKREAKA
jgi:hypothetical protein